MPFTIAVAGKGGTGKTTIAALLIELLRERGAGPILAVDADPNVNLHELLGLEVARTVGELREETLERIADLPAGLPKEQYLELGLQECLVEDEGVDLLVMGHGEGPKCYCMVNHILRKYIDVLRGNYKYVVIDNEAGMEHLSRRTTQDVDALIVVARADPISIRSARRISELAAALKLRIKGRYLLVNDLAGELPPALEAELAQTGLPLLGVVPHDEEVLRLALAGRPLSNLSAGSPAKRGLARSLEALTREERSTPKEVEQRWR
ncbi:MAG: AAA family ATPase [Candidatus Acetothermia bacterium]|jgi:CO dehydrogenase maturation factor|nr:AAA family ATPase [Candidatus Acetothermia bacterium]MDH7505386.1 AAA family ATPase [Candidatus Acetothermia bacterium]